MSTIKVVLAVFIVSGILALGSAIMLAAFCQPFKCWMGWCLYESHEIVWDADLNGIRCRYCGYFEC